MFQLYKNINKKNKSINRQRGMTYVELIVVLSIFSVMSSIALFDYGKFQEKIDIKILANDIALKIVEAQKSSISGKWNLNALSSWKPSYGIYFNTTNNKNFIYFSDLNDDTFYGNLGCTGECLQQITITKGNIISELGIIGTGCPATVSNLNIVFKRPDTSAIITSDPAFSPSCSISYVQIQVTSPRLLSTKIRVYPSGRIQIN